MAHGASRSGGLPAFFRVVVPTAIAFLLALVLEPLIEPDFSPIFLGAIALSTWRWGMQAGVFSGILSGLALLVLFLPPHYTLAIASWAVVVREVSFLATAGLIVWLVKRFSDALAEIRTREERLRIALLKSPVVVFHQNVALRYVWVFHPFPQHDGISLLNKFDYDLFTPAEAAELTRVKQKVLSSGAAVHEEVKLTSGGETRIFELAIEPFRGASGEVEGILGTAIDVTDHRRHEAQLKASQEQLRRLAVHFTEVQEKERGFTSREIHDNVGQILSALDIELSIVAGQMSQGTVPATALPLVNAISEALTRTIDWSEKISTGLKPSLLENLGLAAAIENEGLLFQTRTGIRVNTRMLAPVRVAPEVSTLVFRMYQEVLANVAQHANATEVDTSLRPEGDFVFLKVQDNGRGITTEQMHAPASLGLLELHERARLFGGVVNIHGSPEEGTTLCIGIPNRTELCNSNSLTVLTLGGHGENGGECVCPVDGSPCEPSRCS
jgi:signal transduction histidine kinase